MALLVERFQMRADARDFSAGEDDFNFVDVFPGRAIERGMGSGGIIGNHAAEGGSRTGRDVRPETKSLAPQEEIQIVQHGAGSDPNGAFLTAEIPDVTVVPRKIDDQAIAESPSAQAR